LSLALGGLRVLDFGQGVAGPYCAQQLGDQGADVIKIEPPRGDWSRTMGTPDTDGQGGVFVSVNRNKRGLCLDFRHGEAIAIAKQLAVSADVIIESFRPGVMGKLGLGSTELRATNPGLVYCSITGFGPDGPNVGLPAGDSTMQAYGGLMSIIGERGGTPLRVGNVVSDMLAGMNGFSGVLLALLQRASDGQGRDVQVSLLDSIVAFQAPPLTEFLLTGKLPERMGNDHPLITPSGTIQTCDGAISFTVFDHQWNAFCSGLGMEKLTTNKQFSTSGARQQNRDALSALLAPTFAKQTREWWINKLRAMDVLCAPINDYSDLVTDAQVRHNQLFGQSHSDDRSYPSLRSPIRFSGSSTVNTAPPRLGLHTREILAQSCGCAPDLIEELLARGVALAPSLDQTRDMP
jgi:crotonobetainyl-CoA:carnitine CoA-transferase CaiB-like acyl-CoA transferase